MKRILICQPLALGDLLMTAKACQGLKQAYPEAEISLLGNAAFGPMAEAMPGQARFLALPYQELYKLVNSSDPEAPLTALARLASFTDELGCGYDLIYNPAFNDMAGALSRLTAPGPVVGSDLTAEGHLITRGDWPNLHHLYQAEAAFNPFHTVDLHCLALGLKPEQQDISLALSEENKKGAIRLLKSLGAVPTDRLAAMHTSATRQDKCWPLESFLELGRLLMKRGLKPVFTGNRAEAAQTARLAAALPGSLDAGGKTDIPGLAALLQRCALLISNDSGPIHLASAVGTPVVSISLGKVQFRATGPYRPGSIALEADLDCSPCADPAACQRHNCKTAVKPEHALAAAGTALGKKASLPAGARYFQAGWGEDDLLDWERLDSDGEQGIYAAYRRAWLAALGHGNMDPAWRTTPPPPCQVEPWSQAEQLCAGACRALEAMLSGPGGSLNPAALKPGLEQVNLALAGIKNLGLKHRRIKPLAIYLVYRLGGLDQARPEGQIKAQLGLYNQLRGVTRLAGGFLERGE